MFSFFSLILILKLDEPFRNEEIFIISLFSEVQIWGLGVLQFLVDILPLGSGSVDPNIFAESDPGSQNLGIQRIRVRILSTALNCYKC